MSLQNNIECIKQRSNAIRAHIKAAPTFGHLSDPFRTGSSTACMHRHVYRNEFINMIPGDANKFDKQDAKIFYFQAFLDCLEPSQYSADVFNAIERSGITMKMINDEPVRHIGIEIIRVITLIISIPIRRKPRLRRFASE